MDERKTIIMRYKLIGLAIAAILSFWTPPSIAAEIQL